MTELDRADDGDMNEIPRLIAKIDKLLEQDELAGGPADTPESAGMSDEDAAYARAKLRSMLGLTPPPTTSSDDLEWEHFVLIATATFESELARDSSTEMRTSREVRLADREIVSALSGRPVVGRFRAPVLRLERGDFGTRAHLVGVPVTSERLRLRIFVGDVAVDVVSTNGNYFGETTASIGSEAFSTARVSVSILRQ